MGGTKCRRKQCYSPLNKMNEGVSTCAFRKESEIPAFNWVQCSKRRMSGARCQPARRPDSTGNAAQYGKKNDQIPQRP